MTHTRKHTHTHTHTHTRITVVFIGGNHDTVLDEEAYRGESDDPGTATARQMLSDLITERPNVHYLYNSGVTLLGLKVCMCLFLRVWTEPSVVLCKTCTSYT